MKDITTLQNEDLLSAYEAILNSISDAVIYTDTERRINYINNAAIQLFGYSLDELKGKTTSLLYADESDYLDQGKKRFTPKKAVKSGIYEVAYKRKDSTTFTGETQGNHVTSPTGELLGFIGVIRDITEKKRADELTMRLGRIVEDSLNEIYLFDTESLNFVEVNRGARENLGYSIDELRGITPVDIKPSISAEEFDDLVSPLRTGEKDLLHFETIHERKDGTTYPVEVHLQRVQFDTTDVFLAIILDITDRKQAEEELNRHRGHLEELVTERSAALKEQAQIIDQIHDSVISTDLNGYVTSWNKGAERLFGYTIDDMLGKHISTLYPKEQRSFLEREIITPLKEKGEHETEVQMYTKNHQKFYAQLSLSMLYNDSGEPKGIVGYSMDITARKNAELLAARRSKELAAANEELEGFSYSVSHDLRSPLRAIDGFSMLLSEDYNDVLDNTGKDYLERIRNGAQRMGQLIDDLLQLSKVNREEINRENFDLSSLAQNVNKTLAEHHPERDVNVMIESNQMVNADIGLVSILIDNLMNNAWKYTSQTNEATIEFGHNESDGETIYYVKDNGSGFDPRYVEKIFKPFERLHGSDEFSGTGIGLATVQRIVKRHGGRIWADAEPENGACFYFTLGTQHSVE